MTHLWSRLRKWGSGWNEDLVRYERLVSVKADDYPQWGLISNTAHESLTKFSFHRQPPSPNPHHTYFTPSIFRTIWVPIPEERKWNKLFKLKISYGGEEKVILEAENQTTSGDLKKSLCSGNSRALFEQVFPPWNSESRFARENENRSRIKNTH